DYIITGEGKMDAQTKSGKVPYHIALLAKEKNIPVIGLCGRLDLDREGIRELGIREAAETIDHSLSMKQNMAQAARLLTEKTALLFSRY
ncbi:MAG: glycerate kinase, partial [Bacteroidetes bacterium]|nr:glycerate kinase [Bacteroidota bacterium]